MSSNVGTTAEGLVLDRVRLRMPLVEVGRASIHPGYCTGWPLNG